MAVMWEATTFKGLIGIIDDPKTPVAKACQAVEECIAANRDNLRGFFEQCFAPLVARIFGYSGPSWLAQVARSSKESDARALRRLLSPSGPLFSAVYNADADGSTRFHFPRQRLPAHTQMLLASPAGLKTLSTWPQYGISLEDTAAASKGHIHVSVFQYFCYWFAFYAIKGGDLGTSMAPLGTSGAASGFGSSVRRAADALHLTRGKESDPALRNPYIFLLRQMLTELVPRPVATPTSPLASPRQGATASPRLSSPYFRSSPSKRGSDAASRGVVFYSTLLEFWLKDADEPVATTSTDAGATNRAQRGVVPQPSAVAPLWATSYEPPSEDLLEALGEFVRYVTVALGGAKGTQLAPAQAGSPWLPMTQVLTIQTNAPVASGAHSANAVLAGPARLGAAAQPGAQAVSRQLFRFFHRAFAMWPDQRTIKPLLRVFLAFVAPWQAAPVAAAQSSDSPGALASQFTAQVSGLVHRVRSDAHRNGSASLSGAIGGSSSSSTGGSYTQDWEVHVLSNLPFYLELFPLFLERSISRVSVRGETAVQDVLRVLAILESSPALVDMLREIERDFNRCAASQPRRAEGPYAELLPWLIDQAQDWQVAATANAMGVTPAVTRSTPSHAMFTAARDRCAGLAAKDLLDLASGMLKTDAQKRLRQCLEKVLPLTELAQVTPAAAASAAAASMADAIPRLPRSTWRDVKFKGDVLERPVTSYEIPPLVRIAVAVSQKLNAFLTLDQPWVEDEEPPETRIQEVLVKLRKRGTKADLRPLADVRNLFWIPVGYWILKLFLTAAWVIIAAIMAGITDPEI